MQSLKLPSNSSKYLPNKIGDDVLSADLQNDSLATNPESILTNLNAIHNYLKNLNIGEVDHEALKRYQNILQKFYESLKNKADEANDKVPEEITEIYNKINQQFLKFEKEILQQNSSSSTSTKLPQILEVQTPRSIGTPRQTTPTLTPRDDLIINQQLRISELRGFIKDLNLKINQLQETVKVTDEEKTKYQQELSFYQEQNQFLDKSNTDLKNQFKSLEKKSEDQLQDLKSLKDKNDKLTQEKKLMQENIEQLTEQFARDRTNFRASINQALEGIREVENHKIKLEQEISEYQINADKLKKQIQELTQTNQELLTYAQELELQQTLRDNPINDTLFSEIYSQSHRSSIDARDRISLEGDELLSSSVLGELRNQRARADEDDFPLENKDGDPSNESRTQGDGANEGNLPSENKDGVPADNSIYFSSQPCPPESRILTPSNPFRQILQPQEIDQSSQAQKDLQSEKLIGDPEYFKEELTKKIAEGLAKNDDNKSPIAISSTPQNRYQKLTHSNATANTTANATAIATLGFAGSSSDSDSPDQQQKPSNSPSIHPQQNQLPSTTASQGANPISSNPLLPNTQSSSQTSSCIRLLPIPRCLSPTPD